MSRTVRSFVVFLLSLSVVSFASSQPTQALGPLTVPSFTVTRGANPYLARLNFTADARARYVVHVYFSNDNFVTQYRVNSDYVPGTDVSNIVSSPTADCVAAIDPVQNTDIYSPYPQSYCRLTATFKYTVRFSLLVIERSTQNELSESAKSDPVGFLQGAGSGVVAGYGNRQDGVEGLNIQTYSSSSAGVSKAILGFRRSDDYSVISSYSRDLTANSGSPGFSTSLVGGYSYKFDIKYFGGVSGNTKWFDSEFKPFTTTGFYVQRASQPVSNVIATPTVDGKINVRWTNPTEGNLPATSMVYVSTDKVTITRAVESLVTYPANSVTLSATSVGNINTPFEPGTKYYINIRSLMSSPDSNAAQVWTTQAVTVQMAPGSPNATYTPADKRINVAWEEPLFTGGVSPTGYEIQASSDGTTWTSATFAGSARNGFIDGLTNGTQYTVRLRAINLAGPGTWDSSTSTPIGVPTAATEAVTSISSTSARIAMSLNAQGDNVRVWLEYKLGDGVANEFDLGNTNSSAFNGATTLTNLLPGRLYRVRAKVQASDGNYYYGFWKSFTTTPNAALNAVATSTATSITAAWDTPEVVPTVLKYDVWAERNGVVVGMGCAAVLRSGNRGTCEVAGLEPGILYDIRISVTPTGGDYGNATSLLTKNAISTKRLQIIQDKSGLMPKLYVGIPSPALTTYFSADSGLGISVASTTSTKCLIESGLKLSVRAAGTCTLTISQAGNSVFGPAETKTVSLTVAATQSITFSFASMSSPKVGATPIDISSYASASSGLTVSFQSSTSEVCTIDGVLLTPVSTGECEVIAIQVGDESYMSAPQKTASFFVVKGDQASLSITNETGPFNQPLTLRTSGGSGSGVVTFEINPSGNTSNCQMTATGVKAMMPGNCIVQATKATDANYMVQYSSYETLVFTKANQTITFVQIPDTLEGVTINPTVSTSSGLTVSLQSLTSSVCTISSGSISLDHAGTCSIKASQSGNTSFNAATDVTVTFESNSKASPQTGQLLYDRTRTYYIGDTIDFSVANSINGQESEIPGTFSWLAETPGILQFDSQVPGRATVIGRPSSGGMLQVMYRFTPSAGYIATHNPVLGPAALQIALTPQQPALASQTVVYNEPAQFLVSNLSGTGQLSYGFSPLDSNMQNTSVRNSKCTIDGTVVTRSEPGTCVVRATIASDSQYAAGDVVREFVFTKKPQEIIFVNIWALDDASYATRSTTYDINTLMTSSEGLTVDITTPSSACSITSGVLTVITAGECVIKFTQSGTDTVEAIEEAYFVFEIDKANQSDVSLTASTTTFRTPLALEASGGNGNGSFSFVATDGAASGCRVVDGSLLSDTAGTCLVQVSKAEDANFALQTSSPEVVTIEKASHTLSFSFGSLPAKGVGSAPFSVAPYGQMSSGQTPTFVSGSPSICTVSGTTLTIVSAGQCIVDADFSENESYLAVSTVTRYFSVESTAPVAVVPEATVSEPRNVSLTRGGSKSLVASWAAPISGQSTITTYVATLSPGGKRCSVSVATCTFTGLNATLSYKVSVVAVSATMTSQEGASSGIMPNIQMKPKGKTNLRTMIVAPSKGKQKWSVKGGCKVSGQMFVAAAKPATCTLTLVTDKYKTSPKSTLKVSVQIKK